MKKIIAVLLAFVLMFAMVACGDSDSGDKKDQDDKVVDTDKQDNKDDEDAEEEKEISFEEMVVVDNEECTIKITGIDPEGIMGYTLNVYLENKSSDINYMFAVENAYTDGVLNDPFFAVEVPAGKKTNEEMTFMNTILEENGLTDYTDIELAFRVNDWDDWMSEPVVEETVHVYPYGEGKATTYERETGKTDQVIVDNKYAKITVIGTEVDEIFGYTVLMYIENKTDMELMYSAQDVSVNDFAIDPFYATSVKAGKTAFSSMTFGTEDFEANGITEVEQIELTFDLYDYNNYLDAEHVTETVIFNP